ncbi:hypothetical protein B0H14DRAFT_3686792 [Mycena olivaceomarginata]|nr:hypothetical protein B0H14DRAFT_3686792 [Mycena olivaceomarginata]
MESNVLSISPAKRRRRDIKSTKGEGATRLLGVVRRRYQCPTGWHLRSRVSERRNEKGIQKGEHVGDETPMRARHDGNYSVTSKRRGTHIPTYPPHLPPALPPLPRLYFRRRRFHLTNMMPRWAEGPASLPEGKDCTLSPPQLQPATQPSLTHPKDGVARLLGVRRTRKLFVSSFLSVFHRLLWIHLGRHPYERELRNGSARQRRTARYCGRVSVNIQSKGKKARQMYLEYLAAHSSRQPAPAPQYLVHPVPQRAHGSAAQGARTRGAQASLPCDLEETVRLHAWRKGEGGEEERSSSLVNSKMGRSSGIWGVRVKQKVGMGGGRKESVRVINWSSGVFCSLATYPHWGTLVTGRVGDGSSQEEIGGNKEATSGSSTPSTAAAIVRESHVRNREAEQFGWSSPSSTAERQENESEDPEEKGLEEEATCQQRRTGIGAGVTANEPDSDEVAWREGQASEASRDTAKPGWAGMTCAGRVRAFPDAKCRILRGAARSSHPDAPPGPRGGRR